MSEFFITYVNENTVFPKKESLSAVFLIALDGSKILAIKNERGWDIPGGHIERGETHEEALIREVQEEAGASFSNAKLFAFIESDDQNEYKDKIMLLYTTSDFELGGFTKSEDVLDREVIEIEEFNKRYKENKENSDLSEVISKAQDFLQKSF